MPEKGHFEHRGEAGKSYDNYRRARYAGYGAAPPGHPVSDGKDCVPSNETAAEMLAWIQDPCARTHFELMLEESRRNFIATSARPAWIDPPFASVFNHWMIDGVDTATPVVGNGYYDVFTIDVPEGFAYVLRKLGQGVDNSTAWNEIDWRFVERQYGGAAAIVQEPISPYVGMTSQWGEIDLPTDIWIAGRGPHTVVLQCQNAAGASDRQVWARVVGWKFPMRAPGGDTAGIMLVD